MDYLNSYDLSTIRYQWIRIANNGTRTRLMTDTNTLYFANFRLSESGGYKCDVTINSEVFSYTEYLDIPSENYVYTVDIPSCILHVTIVFVLYNTLYFFSSEAKFCSSYK